MIRRCLRHACVFLLAAFCVSAVRAQTAPASPIRVKVVVVAMFEPGNDTGDVPGEYQLWVEHVVDGDLAYEIDAREIPKNWSTGYIPLGRKKPYEEPPPSAEGEAYTLNSQLTAWAYQLTKNVRLPKSQFTSKARQYRSRFVGFPNALKEPFVTRGDEVSSSTFWHGTIMNRWANDWARYFTGGNYMVSAMEDSGTLQSLTFLDHAGRVDLRRVLVLRMISNYDRQAPGGTAVKSLQSMAGGDYTAYMPALNAAQTVGDKVVRDIVAHWPERKAKVP
jgi:purine nucleoside permease